MAVRRADLEAVLEFVADVGALDFQRPFPPEVMTRLSDLVPAAGLGYQVMDLAARRTVELVGIAGPIEDEEDDVLYWSLGPCPIDQYRGATGDLGAIRLSDVSERRRFVETAFYREYMHPVGIEFMVDVGLPGSATLRRSIYFLRRRSDHDFSERDRLILGLLQPHLVRFETDAVLRCRLAELLRADATATAVRQVRGSPYANLTGREREVVELVAEGKTNAEIAAKLWISPGTVKKHLEHVYEKLGVGRRSAAAAFARSST